MSIKKVLLVSAAVVNNVQDHIEEQQDPSNRTPVPHKHGKEVKAQIRRFLRVDDAAEYLGVSVATLNRLRVHGGGPRYAKLGDRKNCAVVYDIHDLDDFVESRMRMSTSDQGGSISEKAA
jgi:hypothetical protein